MSSSQTITAEEVTRVILSNERQYTQPQTQRKRKLNADDLTKLLKPCHRKVESLLSSQNRFEANYRGIVNWTIIILFGSNLKNLLSNIAKYGIRFSPLSTISFCKEFIQDPFNWPSLCLVFGMLIPILISLNVEKKLAKKSISEMVGLLINSLNLIAVLGAPTAVIFVTHPPPIASFLVLLMSCILWMKLISYAEVNRWEREYSANKGRYRLERKVFKDTDLETSEVVVYPNNLNIRDMAYFIAVPTLCYELNFPRVKEVRISYMLRRLAESLILFQVEIYLIQQWLIPGIESSMKPLREMDFLQLVERLFSLAIPFYFMDLGVARAASLSWIWNEGAQSVLIVGCFFHSLFNFLAEATKFGDREFYRDWWFTPAYQLYYIGTINYHDQMIPDMNSTTIRSFWSLWNIPVHKWCIRHIFKPMRMQGYSTAAAFIFIFLISAFFHEFLISVPLRMIRLWAFTGMFLQIPLVVLTELYFTGDYGNIAMWASLMLGQPTAILMYVHDYYYS